MSAHDPFIRPPYEWLIGLSWGIASLVSIYAWYILPGSASMLIPAFFYGALGVLGVIRGRSLIGRGAGSTALSKITVKKLLRHMAENPDGMWFGWGFEWMPHHTQRAIDFMMARKGHHDGGGPGQLWIHGLNQGAEKQIAIPFKSLEGHTFMVGTTGSGKTRAYEIMVAQAIHRGDTVIMIDPKGDKDLMERMKRECARAGRAEKFIFFHPAFPSTSIRLDPMRNFVRTTELASRLAALLPTDGTAATFTAFSFRAINLIAQGLVETGVKPTLKKLRYYIEGGPEKLLVRAVESHCGKVNPNWRADAEPFYVLARKQKLTPMETITQADMLAPIVFYRQTYSGTALGSEGVDGLINLVEHNRLHFSKMIATLIPLLNMLTSGSLGSMLSPDEDDVGDMRHIFESNQIISGKFVFYMGLDALSDAMVAGAMGSIVLSDFASVAGRIYNRGIDAGRISMFVDEAAEVVNVPFIQILNKARGAGFQVVMATQTVPDITARTGDESRARQILGNCNNLICLRIKDGETQKFVVETFGKTYIQTVSQNIGNSANSADNITHYQGSQGQSLMVSETDLFPQHLLGQLPNFHYVASISGGRIIKGRLPVFSD